MREEGVGTMDDRMERLRRSADRLGLDTERIGTKSEGPRGQSRGSMARRRAASVGVALPLAASAAMLTALHGPTLPAAADAGADANLVALTNQDRASNGVAPLAGLSTLQDIAEGRPYSCGATSVTGRALDMIRRNYFSHVISGCGQYVFSVLSADGVAYTAAGENIGWSSGFPSSSASVGYINNAFMNSPDHRANILDPRFTAMGAGSAWTAGPWTGAGAGYPSVSMFAEVFVAQGGGQPPPTPAPTSPPQQTPPSNGAAPTASPVSTSRPGGGGSGSGGPVASQAPNPVVEQRNEPAPPTPDAAPIATAVPTAAPTAAPPDQAIPGRPRGQALPVPGNTGSQAPAPLAVVSTGVISDGIESVLEGALLG